MFRGRVIFPIISAQGKVLGFGGRALGDAQPKYLNTADTPVFNKRQGLYALNFAKKERSAGHLVLVEGYMDAVSLRKHGVEGVVATLGTALTERTGAPDEALRPRSLGQLRRRRRRAEGGAAGAGYTRTYRVCAPG